MCPFSGSIQLQFRRQAKLAFSLGGLFAGGSQSARGYTNQTKYILHPPHPAAPREVPTPLVFVSASKWDPDSATGMREFAATFASQGFTCLQVDLAHPTDAPTSVELMARFESELGRHIRLAIIPFAPVLVARAGGCLIAQTYISSHPAKALLLIAPPPSHSALLSASVPSTPGLLPTPLPEFTYEPAFPLAILDTPGGLKRLEQAGHRLLKDHPADVDVLVCEDKDAKLDGQDALTRMEIWLDDLGL